MKLTSLLSYAAPYRAALALAGGLMLAESAATLALPWIGGRFAGGLIGGDDGDTGALALLLLLVFALQALLRFGHVYVLAGTSTRVLADLRARTYDHLQSLPIAYFQNRRQGDVLAVLTQEVTYLSTFITGTALSFVPLVLTAAGSIALMVVLEPILGLLVAVLVPSFFLLVRLIGRRLRPLSAELRAAEAAAMADAEENLSLLPAIKAFAREADASARFGARVQAAQMLRQRQVRLSGVLVPLAQLTAAAAVVLLLWALGAGGELEVAGTVSFFLYAALLTRPVGALSSIYGQVQMARGTLQRLGAVLDETPEQAEANPPDLPPVQGDIAFHDVQFSYPRRPPTLDGISLRIAAGSVVALTGENGSGKSTLVNLLVRFHEPDVGTVMIDGRDIARFDIGSVRRQVALVPQQVLLFNATVRDNIALGKAGADDGEIMKAARAAQADRFISELPGGYDAIVGDGGVKLSGGQRQRLGLARALLRDSRIIVLDEPTAMFDLDGETAFVRAFRAGYADRTVILITHRDASLDLADRVVELSAGRLLNQEPRSRG